MPKIIGIMAATPDGIVGKGSGLPWNYAKELEHFRKTTEGQVMVMGRKTFDSCPPALFKQKPIVFSKTIHSSKLCTVVGSIEEFLHHLEIINCDKIFMIGGAAIAEFFLKNNLISEFIFTKVHKNYEGDSSMDLKLLDNWHQMLLTKTKDYTIYRLTNPKGDVYEIY